MLGKLKNDPFFSIIIPVWNWQESIKRCLGSILVQDYNNYEIIVVDDGSTDDTVAVLESYADKRLRIVKHSENRGICAARNSWTAELSGV